MRRRFPTIQPQIASRARIDCTANGPIVTTAITLPFPPGSSSLCRPQPCLLAARQHFELPYCMGWLVNGPISLLPRTCFPVRRQQICVLPALHDGAAAALNQQMDVHLHRRRWHLLECRRVADRATNPAPAQPARRDEAARPSPHPASRARPQTETRLRPPRPALRAAGTP